MKTVRAKLVIGVLVLGAAVWFLGGAAGSSTEVENFGPIKIGGISALSGVGSAIGVEEKRGAELAVQEINERGGVNGRKLELVSEDLSIDKLKTAVSVAEKLISVDKVVAIVGAQWDEPTEPILPTIENSKVPTVGADNSDQLEKDKDYEYYFSTWYDNRVGVRELLRFAQSKGWKRIVIIRPVNAGFWKFTADTMSDEASKYGVEIVDDIDMGNPLSLDFRTPIVKLKQLKPDAVFAVTSDYNQCTYLKQASALGFKVPKLGTESSGDYVSLRNCPKLLENTYFSSPKITKSGEKFNQNFKTKFGVEPKFPSAVTAYDAVYVIAEALKRTGGKGGEPLRREIQKTDIQGAALESIVFNQKGFVSTPEDTFVMRTVKDGTFVDLK